MRNVIFQPLKAAFLGGLLLLVAAFHADLRGASGSCRSCPHCEHGVCVPVPTTITDKKSCWEIAYKDICIPSFKWPWQSCCETPPCGRTKTVKTLKKVEYECQRCGYKWENVCGKCIE